MREAKVINHLACYSDFASLGRLNELWNFHIYCSFLYEKTFRNYINKEHIILKVFCRLDSRLTTKDNKIENITDDSQTLVIENELGNINNISFKRNRYIIMIDCYCKLRDYFSYKNKFLIFCVCVCMFQL